MISPETMNSFKVKIKDKVTSTTPGKWGRVGAGVLVGGLAIGWLVFPFLLDKVVASQINLSHGKDSRKLWTQLPTLDFHLYLFNITNPEQVMRGAKPRVEEVGPYCYKEIKDKIDFLEDPNTDTISYSARSTWYDNQKGPNCPTPHLTGEEMLVVPNIPLLAILLIGEKDFPPAMMSLVNQALPSIFGRLTDMFMRVSARRLLFDGVPINCSARALYPRAVCIALKQNSRALKKLGNNQYEFSFFGPKNHTPEEFRYTVKRGTEDVKEVGRLVAIDGKPQMPFWRGECNKIQGTDSTVFPPFRQKENGSLAAYSSEICRVIIGVYEGEYDYKGVTGYAYSASFGDTENNPGDRCFCPADDRCRKRGVLESLKCQGAPIVASHPHFYLGSPDYVNGVEGLNPSKEKHGILIVLEPISGSPLVVRKRLQFNIDLKPISYVPLTQRLRRTLVPLVWAEEALDLDSSLMGVLESSLFLPIRAVDVLKWLCVVLGVGLGVAAVVLKYRKHHRDKVHVFNNEEEPQDAAMPRPAVKLEELNVTENHNYDPFYVPQHDTEQRGKSPGENGLSALALVKNMTTATSAGGVKMINADRITSPQNGIDRNANYFLDKTKQSEEDHSVYLASRNASSPNLNFTDLVHSSLNDAKEKQRFGGETNLGFSADVNSSQVNSPTKTLELQMSSVGFPSTLESKDSLPGNQFFATTSNSQPSAFVSFLPDQDRVLIPQTHFDDDNYYSIKSEESKFENPTNTTNFSGTVAKKVENKSFDEAYYFGEPTSRPPSEQENSSSLENGVIPRELAETNENNAFVGERSKETPVLATAEEIKEVEEDIGKLMAEIAQLMPKNK